MKEDGTHLPHDEGLSRNAIIPSQDIVHIKRIPIHTMNIPTVSFLNLEIKNEEVSTSY